MNTRPISEDSIMRRVDCLRHFVRQRKKFDVFKNQTDRDRAHHQISAGYSLMVYFTGSFWFLRSSYFSPEKGVFVGWMMPCGVILFCLWLVYWTFKLRWACKVFDVFGVTMVSEIETRLAEQTVLPEGNKPTD